MIELFDICKDYRENGNVTSALRGISLRIEKGEMVCIMGMSGSGKSTLLNIIGGMDSASNGEYYFEGEKVEAVNGDLHSFRKKNISFIFQNYALLEKYTVYENVEMPLRARRIGNRKEIILSALKKMRIDNLKDKYPSQLSGGERQRCAIARAIVSETPIILADEPTGSLDRKTGEMIMDYLSELNKAGKTIVIVTHDIRIAERCTRILWIEDGLVTEKRVEEKV